MVAVVGWHGFDAEAARGGDRAAFATLIGRHYDRIFGLAFRLTGSRADAEDLAQGFLLLEDFGDGVFARLMAAMQQGDQARRLVTAQGRRFHRLAARDGTDPAQFDLGVGRGLQPVGEGLAEGDVPKAPGADLMADKEALELVRSYYAIPEAQRRRLFDLARVLSDAA